MSEILSVIKIIMKKHSKKEEKFEQSTQKKGIIDSTEQKQILKYEEEVVKLTDLFIREKADSENLRKFAITNFAKALIEQVEDLFRALENVDQDACSTHKELKALFEGIEMIKNNMLKSFEDFGVRRIYPLNEQFNHEYHQAISQVVDNDKEPNTIVKVVQAGYSIKERLLRSAVVVVSKRQN